MAYKRPNLTQGNGSAIGTGNATITDTATFAKWASIPDGSTLTYEIRNVPDDGHFESGLGTKTTVAGKPVLIRTAANVDADSSSGAGVLVNFTASQQLIYPAQIGSTEVDPNVSADPSVTSLGQHYYRTDLDRFRCVFSSSPAIRNYVTDTFYGHSAFGANSAIDDGSLLFPGAPFSNVITIEESSTSPGTGGVEITGISNQLLYNPSTTPDPFCTVAAIDCEVATPHANSLNIPSITGVIGNAFHLGSGTVTNLYGCFYTAGSSGQGVITNCFALNTGTFGPTSGNGSITNAYGIFLSAPVGKITNNYGLFIQDQTGGTSQSWNIWSDGAGFNTFLGRTFVGAPATAPVDANLQNSQITFYLDEAGNNLKIRVKYSNGTIKTATIALV